jgi:hypothetical protein
MEIFGFFSFSLSRASLLFFFSPTVSLSANRSISHLAEELVALQGAEPGDPGDDVAVLKF